MKGRALACALVLGAWAWVFGSVWAGVGTHQFDFKTYYCAAQVYDAGRDPYDVANLREVGGNSHLLGFYYPLSALQLLRPLGHLDYAVAHRVWVALKALALIGLLVVWKRWFLSRTSWPVVLIGALLAFQAATVWDITAGNVTVFEQLFLWTGLAFLVASRPSAFVVCVVIASTAKLMPAAFLLLLFLPALRSRANTLRALAGLAAVGLIALLPFAAAPEYRAGFVAGLTSQHPPLRYNPSIQGLIDEAARHPGAGFLAGGWPRAAAFVAYYALVVALSARLVRRVFGRGSVRDAILVGALLYALVAPRLIVYSYMIAIVPVLALLFPRAGTSVTGAAALLAVLCVGGLAILPGEAGAIAGALGPLLLLWLCWGLLIGLERTGALEGHG